MYHKTYIKVYIDKEWVSIKTDSSSFSSKPQLIILCNTGEYAPYLELTFIGDDFVFWQHREKGLWPEGRVWVRTLLGAYTWGTSSKKRKEKKLAVNFYLLVLSYGAVALPSCYSGCDTHSSLWIWLLWNLLEWRTRKHLAVGVDTLICRLCLAHTMLCAFRRFTASLRFGFPTWIWRQWHLEMTALLDLAFKVIFLEFF